MRFTVRSRIMGIGDDSWIEDEDGRHAFLVDGKALRVRRTFELRSPDGEVLAVVRRRMLGIRDTMTVERGGRPAATVRKHLISLPRDRFTVELAEGGEWSVTGNVFRKEYTVAAEEGTVAVISRKWVQVGLRDTYAVEVAEGADVPLALAVAIAVDTLSEGKGG
ncbi:LURP-one-related/scramblase family protein [Actinomadura kijaniata]|uniref:LURP-one-related/scramblase family protein n=1 Tax=Actinomadura kijaniata TaxID=46161 RepID=UPI0008321924|nr:LURP-one-related family protein [Actinomadura kijaniata]